MEILVGIIFTCILLFVITLVIDDFANDMMIGITKAWINDIYRRKRFK
jgi:hypothetical protein